jgi:uncharacterized protein
MLDATMALDIPPDRETVLRVLRDLRAELARAFGVRSILLFGSVARGDAGPESDVDLLVEFDRPVGLLALATLRRTLSERLGRPVDVGTVDSLRPRARAAALAEAVRVA